MNSGNMHNKNAIEIGPLDPLKYTFSMLIDHWRLVIFGAFLSVFLILLPFLLLGLITFVVGAVVLFIASVVKGVPFNMIWDMVRDQGLYHMIITVFADWWYLLIPVFFVLVICILALLVYFAMVEVVGTKIALRIYDSGSFSIKPLIDSSYRIALKFAPLVVVGLCFTTFFSFFGVLVITHLIEDPSSLIEAIKKSYYFISSHIKQLYKPFFVIWLVHYFIRHIPIFGEALAFWLVIFATIYIYRQFVPYREKAIS